jgi:hypothetical protein
MGLSSNYTIIKAMSENTVLKAVSFGGVPRWRAINTGAGLTGGGDLTQDRTIALNAASIASLALADTAAQPGDNVSSFNNDAGYVDAGGAAAAAPVQSVASKTGVVTLEAADITDSGTKGRALLALADDVALRSLLQTDYAAATFQAQGLAQVGGTAPAAQSATNAAIGAGNVRAGGQLRSDSTAADSISTAGGAEFAGRIKTNSRAQARSYGSDDILFGPSTKDTAVFITLPANGCVMMISTYNAGQAQLFAILSIRASTTPHCVKFSGGSLVETATGVLSGTTGNDGVITVSPDGTNGRVYIENRVSSNIRLRTIFFNVENTE